jgi:asparagine synthase (glutamine-hydrolysing)
MCGIWTYIQLYKDKELQRKILKNFWDLDRRGPDNSILQSFNNVLVGFHRLSIMDKSFKSNQPFIFQDTNRTIVFICNGEIYNFKDLIKKHDLDIKTNSDCMTIPLLYLKYSNNSNMDEWYNLFKKEIKGEFAFVLYEFDNFKNIRKIIVGRDQIGVRPLYKNKYLEERKDFFYSSEIKGMNNYVGEVEEFEPGIIHTIKFDEFSNVSISNFNFKWVYDISCDYDLLNIDNERLELKLLSNLRIAVINSVRRRLDADRPLGFLLSGGVDSSLVCAIASRILKEPINTFCCGMEEGTDLEYARKVSNFIKSNHKEVIFAKDEGFRSIPDVVYAVESWDTTTIRASVGQYMVSKYIGEKTDCRVILVGEGPDEVCSSYMFNWNAPNGDSLDKAAKELVKEIHYYDCKRSDRCISYFGLEGRVPLLDPEVIKAYWSIPSEWRHPKYKGIEKWWLRKAFDSLNILPKEVLWRKKEAFSDGVSSKKKSWFEIIQNNVDEIITDKEFTDRNKDFGILTPTKEAYFYMKLYKKYFKNKNIIKKYWQPKWCNTEGYIDPSARVLDCYEEEKKNNIINSNNVEINI